MKKRESDLVINNRWRILIKYVTDNYHESPHRFQKLSATPVIDSVPEVWMLEQGGGVTKIAARMGRLYLCAFIPSVPRGIQSIKEYRENFRTIRNSE